MFKLIEKYHQVMHKISKETKIALCKLLQKYDTIISKSDKDVNQTDVIEMHIDTGPVLPQLQPNHAL